jgi:hypothetical protein
MKQIKRSEKYMAAVTFKLRTREAAYEGIKQG